MAMGGSGAIDKRLKILRFFSRFPFVTSATDAQKSPEKLGLGPSQTACVV
jgi:hypothetical protein